MAEIFLNLLFLSGKYLTQVAGKSLLFIYHKSTKYQQRLLKHYDRALCMTGREKNLLEVLHSRVQDTNFGAGLATYRHCGNSAKGDGVEYSLNSEQFGKTVTTSEIGGCFGAKRNCLGDETLAFNSLMERILSDQVLSVTNILKRNNLAVSKHYPGILHTNTTNTVILIHKINTPAQFPKSDSTNLYMKYESESNRISNDFIKGVSKKNVAAIVQKIHNGHLKQNKDIAIIKLIKVITKDCLAVQENGSSCTSLVLKEHEKQKSPQFHDEVQNNFATKEKLLESSTPLNFTRSLSQQSKINEKLVSLKRGSSLLKFPDFLKILPQLIHALQKDLKEKQRQCSVSESAKATSVQDNGCETKLAYSGVLNLINVLNTIRMSCLIHLYEKEGNQNGQSNLSRECYTDYIYCKCADASQKGNQNNSTEQLKTDRRENAESFRQSNSFFISRSSYMEKILNMQNEIDFDHLLQSLQNTNKIRHNIQLMAMLNSMKQKGNSDLILPFRQNNQFLHEWNVLRKNIYSFDEHMLRKLPQNCSVEYVLKRCLFEAPGFKEGVHENASCKAVAELCSHIQKKLISNATDWNLLNLITTISKNRDVAENHHRIQPPSSTINRTFSKVFFEYKENPWFISNDYNAPQLNLLDPETRCFVDNILNSSNCFHYFPKTLKNSEIKTFKDGADFARNCLNAVIQLQNAASHYITVIRNINYQCFTNLQEIMGAVAEHPKLRDDQVKHTLCSNGTSHQPKGISLFLEGQCNKIESNPCVTAVKTEIKGTQDFRNLTFKYLQPMIDNLMGKSKIKEMYSDFPELLVLPLIERLFIDIIIKSHQNCSLKGPNSNSLDTIMQLQEGVNYYFSDLKYINYLTFNKCEEIMHSLAKKSMEVGKWKQILSRPEKVTNSSRLLNFSELIVLKHVERQVADMLIQSCQHPEIHNNQNAINASKNNVCNVFVRPKETTNSFFTISKLQKGGELKETPDNSKKDKTVLGNFIKSCSNPQHLHNNGEPEELNKKTTFPKKKSGTSANFDAFFEFLKQKFNLVNHGRKGNYCRLRTTSQQKHLVQNIESKLKFETGSEIEALELSEQASTVIQRKHSTMLTQSQLGNTHPVTELVKTSCCPLLDINFTLTSLELKRQPPKTTRLGTQKIINYLNTCLCQVASFQNMRYLQEHVGALHGVYTARKDANLDGDINEQASIIDINRKVFDDLETHIRTIKIIDKPKKSDEKSEENDPAIKDEDDSANRHFSGLPPILMKSDDVVLSPILDGKQYSEVDCLESTQKPSTLKNWLFPAKNLDGYKQLLRMEIDKDISLVLKKHNYNIDKIVDLILPKCTQNCISTQLIQTIPIDAVTWLCEQLALENDNNNDTIEQQIVNKYGRLYKSLIVILTSNLHVTTHMEQLKTKSAEHLQAVLIVMCQKLQSESNRKKTPKPNQGLPSFEHLQLCSIIERMHKKDNGPTLDKTQDRQPTGKHVWNKPPIHFKKNICVSIFPESTIWNACPKLLQPLCFQIANVSKQIQAKHYLPKRYRYETKEVDSANGDKIKITRLIRVKLDV